MSNREEPTRPPQNNNDDLTVAPKRIKDEDLTTSPNLSAPSGSGFPELEGYEILGELGRGGMGVVYKARDKRLDRVVALKMILAGNLASAEEIRRFQLEAETAAKLDHPGIVPIYEIGQSGGFHFFAMKLIDGQPLSDHLEEYQNDSRKAVELMIEIARAVHHAHQRGVLHRDLKPANVLVDGEGNPAVTDLGLAKQLGDDSGLTRTGLVMGSPGFMAPEQARGLSDVTTSVDVYSLGAILFWMITGRPPFRGETQVETIMQTIEKEAESVRVYRPDADRELNLICQKALQKTPDRRYLTAAEFADDLQAWLDGDALSVKPPTPIDLVRIWIRKNVRTLSLALVVGVLSGLLVGGIIFLVSAYPAIRTSDLLAEKLGFEQISWLSKYFGWIRDIPIAVVATLPPLMVWGNVGLGILAIGLIKPKSREVTLVAATAAALLAGTIAYTIGIGWYPMSENALDNGRQDIELLSTSAWMRTANDHKLSQDAILQRYPGLNELDSDERGLLVLRKIINDQRTGIPIGMLVGIGTTLCISVLPLFFAITFAGHLWDQGNRGFVFGCKSAEFGIYAGIFFLILSKFVTDATGLRPHLFFQLATLFGVLVALYFAINDWNWPWRILAFVLATICIMSNMYEGERINASVGVLDDAQSDEELRDLKYLLVEKVSRKDDGYDRFCLGVYEAYLNNDSEYAKQCATRYNDFEFVFRASSSARFVKLCCLMPDKNSLSSQQMDRVFEVADFVSNYESVSNLEWLYLARAMAELRQGNDEDSLNWTGRIRDALVEKKVDPFGSFLFNTSNAIDALASQALGRTNESEKLGNRVEKYIKAFSEKYPDDTCDVNFLIIKILHREWKANEAN